MNARTGRRPGSQPSTLQGRLERDTSRTPSCWLWIGPVASNGYGRVSWHGTRLYAHRVSYETHVGPIPDGLVIDHLCRVPLCVNPQHLEAVTIRTNVSRGEAPNMRLHREKRCARGHAVTPENTYHVASGRTMCRPCLLERSKRYRQAKR